MTFSSLKVLKMNIEYLQESLDYLMYLGIKLSPEQKILIENSLITLQTENRFEAIFFWGRINGIERDYYIAYGYRRDCIKDRKYFYSVDCYQWFMLPFIQSAKLFQATMLCREPYYGDPSLKTCVKLVSRKIKNFNKKNMQPNALLM